MSKLLPGENLVRTAHAHWITVVNSLVIPVVLLIVVAIADIFWLRGSGAPAVNPILTLAAIAFALLWFIVVWVRWQSIKYTLTDQRIKIETGVFGRQEKVIPIDRVQDCTTKQSIIGRILGYGRVEIDAAGAQGAEILDHLPNPGDFRDQVFVQSEKRRGGPEPDSQPAVTHTSGL